MSITGASIAKRDWNSSTELKYFIEGVERPYTQTKFNERLKAMQTSKDVKDIEYAKKLVPQLKEKGWYKTSKPSKSAAATQPTQSSEGAAAPLTDAEKASFLDVLDIVNDLKKKFKVIVEHAAFPELTEESKKQAEERYNQVEGDSTLYTEYAQKMSRDEVNPVEIRAVIALRSKLEDRLKQTEDKIKRLDDKYLAKEAIDATSSARTRMFQTRAVDEGEADDEADDEEDDEDEEPGEAAGGGSGNSEAVEMPPQPTVSMNDIPGGTAKRANKRAQKPLPAPVIAPAAGPPPGAPPAGPAPEENAEEEAQITSESTRQSELSASEVVSLQYKNDFMEQMDNQFMRLATDQERGNLGAGTSAEMQSADLWGNLLTQSKPDKLALQERFIPTQPGSTTLDTADTEASTEDVYSFLPFAKLGGSIVWIPRHVQAARFFFTSDDYNELVSHIRDGNPLTLDATNDVDPLVMRTSITSSHQTLIQFCQLNPPLPTSASTEQVYAEWLEMKQIGKAVSRYQQITGGMYENTDLTMKGGIRAAVASALKPFIQAWNQLHPGNTIATDEQAGRPGSRPLFSSKRKAEAGIVLPEEYNPQFSYTPLDLKRVKFSIPNI